MFYLQALWDGMVLDAGHDLFGESLDVVALLFCPHRRNAQN
jgi:hypothetical protein